MKTTYKFFPLLLLVLALASSCGSKKEKSETTGDEPADSTQTDETSTRFTKEQFTTAGIALGNVGEVPLSGELKVSGVLDVPPESLAEVSAPLGGFLKATTMLQGAYVKKGQVVAVMQDQSYIQMQQDYLDSKSKMEFLETEYERQQELAKENVNSKKSLQQSKSDFMSITAQVNGLKKKLEMINIPFASLEKGDIQGTINLYAPISGYVTKINVNIGAYVNPSTQMFEIVDTKHLHAELSVFEKDVPKLKIGQQVRFTLANETKERISTIYLIGREIGVDRTVRVHCHLSEEDTELLPGTFFKAVVAAERTPTPALPDGAILSFEGKQYVIACTSKPGDAGNKSGEYEFRMVEVQTGVSENGNTAVTLPKGFDQGKEAIVVKGSYDVLSKIKNGGEEE